MIGEDGVAIPDDKKISEGTVVVTKIPEDTMVVDKIMSSRMGEREIEPEEGAEVGEEEKLQTIQVEEYYVKYKNLSYLHCEWKTEEELERGDKRVNQKIKRFKQKKESGIMFDFLDDEPFNPDYTEVDRILDVTEVEDIMEILDSKVKAPEESEQSESKEVSVEKQDPDETIINQDISMEEKTSEKEPKEEVDGSTSTGEANEVEMKDSTEAGEAEKCSETSNPIKSEEPVPEKSTEDENLPKKTEIESKDDQELVSTVSKEENEEDSEMKTDEKPPSDDVKSPIATENETKMDESKNDSTQVTAIKVEPDKTEEKPEPEEEPKPVQKRTVNHYLVKWRALPYEESTWELEDDLDPAKIEHFWKFRNPPPKEKWKPKKRPKAHEWKQLTSSPSYKSGNTLREYQLEGLNWLMFCWHQG